MIALAAPAFAQPPEGPRDLERGYGMGWDSFDNPINIGAADRSDIGLFVDGRLSNASTLSGGLMDSPSGLGNAQIAVSMIGVLSGGAVNPADADITQINNGDISAAVQGAN
jgi:hypothetical protein